MPQLILRWIVSNFLTGVFLGTPLRVGCDFFIASFGSVDAINMVSTVCQVA